MADVTLPAIDAGSIVRPRTFLEEDAPGGGKQYTAYSVDRGVAYSAAGKTPVTAKDTPFAPIAGRPFNITIAGGTFTAQVERKFPGDANFYVVIPDSMRAALPSSFTLTEAEVGVEYKVTVLTGTATTVRISQ